jgi:hypothetical protein
MGDFSGKNMKHVAQWLAREGVLDIDVVKGLYGWGLDEMYMILSQRIKETQNQRDAESKSQRIGQEAT